MNVTIELAVEDPAWERVADLPALAEEAIRAAVATASPGPAPAPEISCLFCDDATIRELNARWRGVDKPTNVLSFPAGGREMPDGPRLLGDIAIAYGTVEREARDQGKTIEAHTVHLLVHGTLHLLGHDHEEAEEAEAMESIERRVMRSLGRPDPYAGLEPADTP